MNWIRSEKIGHPYSPHLSNVQHYKTVVRSIEGKPPIDAYLSLPLSRQEAGLRLQRRRGGATGQVSEADVGRGAAVRGPAGQPTASGHAGGPSRQPGPAHARLALALGRL